MPFRHRIGPVITLMFLAPMIAEVLPGATRLSAWFVIPIEMCIWGAGAVLIRAAAKHWNLGWLPILLMGFALAIAEECLIQQTSLAPMYLQIVKGADYARAFGVNYLYLLWALFYEAVLVVVVPIMVVDLIFRSRRNDPWIRRPGAIVLGALFLVACIPAWAMWTRMVRDKVLHVGIYDPPAAELALFALIMALLIFVSIGPTRRALSSAGASSRPPSPWLLGVLGFAASLIWYALSVFSFREWPMVSPAIPVTAGLVTALVGFLLMSRYVAHPEWGDTHRVGLIWGVAFGMMLITFVGFYFWSTPLDFWGKVILDAIAAVLMLVLSIRVARNPRAASGPVVL